MTIEEIRKSKINRLNEEIKSNDKHIENIKAAIHNISKEKSFPAEYIEKQITQRNERISHYIDRKKFLETQIQLIKYGSNDIALMEEINENVKRQNAKNKPVLSFKDKQKDKAKEKAKDKAKEKLKDKSLSKVFPKVWADYNNEYRYMDNVTKYLPGHLQNNLKTMPENKGYIYKGVWFFGQAKPDNSVDIVMFEKKGGDILYIHQYHNKRYSLFEKRGKNPKVQIR